MIIRWSMLFQPMIRWISNEKLKNGRNPAGTNISIENSTKYSKSINYLIVHSASTAHTNYITSTIIIHTKKETDFICGYFARDGTSIGNNAGFSILCTHFFDCFLCNECKQTCLFLFHGVFRWKVPSIWYGSQLSVCSFLLSLFSGYWPWTFQVNIDFIFMLFLHFIHFSLLSLSPSLSDSSVLHCFVPFCLLSSFICSEPFIQGTLIVIPSLQHFRFSALFDVVFLPEHFHNSIYSLYNQFNSKWISKFPINILAVW